MKSVLVSLGVLLTALTFGAPVAMAQGLPMLATGAGGHGGPHVEIFTPQDGVNGEFFPIPVASFFAYDPTFTGGVRVAVGRVLSTSTHGNLITAPGPGGSTVKIWDLNADGTLASPDPAQSFDPYPGFTGGIFVAVCNLDGGAIRALLTAPDTGGGPNVKVYSEADPGTPLGNQVADSFYAFEPTFTGGVRVACGPLDFDGRDNVVVAAGPGGGPHVIVYGHGAGDPNIVSAQPVADSFYAYAETFTGGVFVAAGVNSHLAPAPPGVLYTGAGGQGGPHVKAFHDPAGNAAVSTGPLLDSFFAYADTFTGGVRVAASRDLIDLLVTAPGPGGGPHVLSWVDDDNDGAVSDDPHSTSMFAYDPTFTGGVYVAIGVTAP